MARQLFISTGYVENAQVGCLPVVAYGSFASVEETLYFFGKDLWDSIEYFRTSQNEEVQERFQKGLPQCCQDTREQKLKARGFLCGKCWAPCILDTTVTSPDSVVNYIRELTGLTNDTSDSLLWQDMQNKGWEIGMIYYYPGTCEMVSVDNYYWFPNYNKYKLGEAEWTVAQMVIPEKKAGESFYNKIPLDKNLKFTEEEQQTDFDFTFKDKVIT